MSRRLLLVNFRSVTALALFVVLSSCGFESHTRLFDSTRREGASTCTPGELDTAYGPDRIGVVNLMPPRATASTATALAALADGSVFVAGNATNRDGYYPRFVAKLRANGDMDARFGEQGFALLDVESTPGSWTQGSTTLQIMELSDGRILLWAAVHSDVIPSSARITVLSSRGDVEFDTPIYELSPALERFSRVDVRVVALSDDSLVLVSDSRRTGEPLYVQFAHVSLARPYDALSIEVVDVPSLENVFALAVNEANQLAIVADQNDETCATESLCVAVQEFTPDGELAQSNELFAIFPAMPSGLPNLRGELQLARDASELSMFASVDSSLPYPECELVISTFGAEAESFARPSTTRIPLTHYSTDVVAAGFTRAHFATAIVEGKFYSITAANQLLGGTPYEPATLPGHAWREIRAGHFNTNGTALVVGTTYVRSGATDEGDAMYVASVAQICAP